MDKLHNILMGKNGAYASWHKHEYHKPTHWIVVIGVFIFFSALVGAKYAGLKSFQSLASNNFTCNYWASPTGTSGGNGGDPATGGTPWDLQTALNKVSELNGKTLCLKGGTYVGKFTSRLVNATVRGITMSPTNPNGTVNPDWAKIDGYATTNLAPGQSMGVVQNNPDRGCTGSCPLQPITVNDGSKIPAGSSIIFHDQANEWQEEFLSVETKTGQNVLNVRRQMGNGNGTSYIQSHSAGALIIVGGNDLDIDSAGHDTVYRDFEITNSDPVRNWGPFENTQSAPHFRGECVGHYGPRTHLINLILHDCQEGIFGGPSSEGSTTYGNIIYNNGYTKNRCSSVTTNPPCNPEGNLYAGHGWYIQNEGATKTYQENFTFNNSENAAQEESVSGNTINISNIGNVVVNNTFLIGANGADLGRYADNVTTDNSFFYSNNTRGNLRMGYSDGDILKRMTITNSYFGIRNDINSNTEPTNVDVKPWVNATITNNIFVTAGGYVKTLTAKAPAGGGAYAVNNNTYYDQSRILNCSPGNWRGPFGYSNSGGVCGGSLKFAEWKSTSGFDSASNYNEAVAPDKVEVRASQPLGEAKSGRANVVIYNWSKRDYVPISLSGIGLSDGQGYEIRSVFNYLGAPVATGSYTSSNTTVSIDMRASSNTPTQPLGSGLATRINTFPEFGAFVIIPTTTSSSTPTPPTITSFSSSPASITAGASSTLSWNVTGATSLSINGSAVTGTSTTVSPTTTTTYTLTATNSTGSTTATTTVTVTVSPPPAPVITSFTASPTTITQGGSSTLTWNVTGATSLTINGSAVTGTSTSVSPTTTTTYTLVATNTGGSTTATATVGVNAPPTPTGTISATNCTIATGASTCNSSVTWSTANLISGASTAVTRDNPTNTQVSTNTSGTNVSNTVRFGTSNYFLYHNNVQLASTAITAACITGSTWNGTSCAITTASLPVITSFTASPTSITAGGSSTLSWNVTGATTLSINNGVGTVSGTSTSVSPLATTLYTLSATNTAGASTAGATVSVTTGGGGTPTGTITAGGCQIAAGASTCGSDVNWSTSNLIPGANTAVIKNNPDNTTVSTNTSGSIINNVNYGQTFFYLYHNGVLLASDSQGASCVSGTTWNGSTCGTGTTTGDTTPPTVSLTSPTEGQSIRRRTTITMRADATDNTRVTKVEFYVNGSRKCTDTTASYTCKWTTPSVSVTTPYTITAKAYDAAGNTTTSTAVGISVTR